MTLRYVFTKELIGFIKKIDWMLILFLGGFTFSIYLCFKADFEMTKNIFFIIGIIGSYIFILLVSEEAKKEYYEERKVRERQDQKMGVC